MAVKSDLEITGLDAGYGKLAILDGVDLSVKSGEFIAILGPNGAGKSTFLKVIFGMASHMGGKVMWKGENIAGMAPKAVLSRGIAYVPQGRCNFPLMSIEENLEMASYAMPQKQTQAERDHIFELFPILKERRSQLAGNLSGGEQQLLEMAMAMLRRPEILMIDEPSAGLSPQAISIVFRELKRLHEGGRTVLLVEQNTKRAMEIAERTVVLRLGKVIWDGSTRSISHGQLGELFMTGAMKQPA